MRARSSGWRRIIRSPRRTNEDMGLLEAGVESVNDPQSPLSAVRALAYDVVLNGTELGSGSIRIHRQDIQSKIFRALGMTDEEAKSRFGFFLEALEYGTPPHGGIALGLDRIVMILAGAESLREVIPFPKTARAVDLMVDAPTPVSEQAVAGVGDRGEEISSCAFGWRSAFSAAMGIFQNEKTSRIFLCLAVLFCKASLPISAQQSVAGDASAIVEQGKFTLHKFEQPIGEETYEIRRDGDSLAVKMDFKFTDRGSPVPLTATFRGAAGPYAAGLRDQRTNCAQISIDEAVTIDAGKVHFRTRDKTERPHSAFGAVFHHRRIRSDHHADAHGALLGHARFARAAADAAERHGESRASRAGHDSRDRKRRRERRETRPLHDRGLDLGTRDVCGSTANRNLVAAITTDAEFDHFEAIRDGYESALGDFVGRAGADGMSALAEISKGISGSRASTLAIVGGTLIDGTGAAPIPDAAVVIQNGRIVAAGPRSKVKIPKDANVVDAHGKTILPGLWDMHAHFEQVEWGPIYLAAGVTTVRDCGNEFEFITAVRDAIAQGRGLGPRLLLAGIVDGSGTYTIGVERVDTPEQARMWTDRYHAAGFQQMKIYSSVKLEELKAVADEAHRLGMTVTGHVPEGLNAYQAIEAGQDQINHIGYVADIMKAPLPRRRHLGSTVTKPMQTSISIRRKRRRRWRF